MVNFEPEPPIQFLGNRLDNCEWRKTPERSTCRIQSEFDDAAYTSITSAVRLAADVREFARERGGSIAIRYPNRAPSREL